MVLESLDRILALRDKLLYEKPGIDNGENVTWKSGDLDWGVERDATIVD